MENNISENRSWKFLKSNNQMFTSMHFKYDIQKKWLHKLHIREKSKSKYIWYKH